MKKIKTKIIKGVKEKKKNIPSKDTLVLPILPVKDVVLYPHIILPLVVHDKDYIAMLDESIAGDKRVAVFLSRKTDDDSKGGVEKKTKAYNLYEYGCEAEVLKMLRFPDGSMRLLVQGNNRIILKGFVQRVPYFIGKLALKPVIETPVIKNETEAFMRNIVSQFLKMIKVIPYYPEELQVAVVNIKDPIKLAYVIASNLNISIEEKQRLLEESNVKELLNRILTILNNELDILEIGNQIQTQIQNKMSKAQRDHILREQLKIIQKELGEGDDLQKDIIEYKNKIKNAKMPEEAEEVTLKELDRMSKMHPSSAEYSVSRTYLDWLTELPWSVSTKDILNISHANKVLNNDHYGLSKVKERILEFLAVRKLKNDIKSPILCFVGPPGVGKTSLGMSIARAMDRKFIRMSLGGVKDEAEIRGHRRTYVGALPGRIIQNIKKCGSNNPVFMLDEIDKLGSDFRGDPSSALLEVLDPEQNFSFQDHYLDVSFDLTKVMFITTANVLDTIPPPLRDRMETIELPGYTDEDKIYIAQRHLIPKQLKEHGFNAKEISFTNKAVKAIVNKYTYEAGVRNLERQIANILRKIARKKVENKKFPKNIKPEDLHKFLGKERFYKEVAERTATPGVATGLAWTPFGGEILFIESTMMQGNGKLILTGHLGDVMKESAQAALSYIKSNSKKYKLDGELFSKNNIHIHVPAGAIPKDGPSAGVSISTSLFSLLTNTKVRNDVAMTGEITLRGKVLPVGGIKEKVLGANRAGINTVILPDKNRKDISELPANVRKMMKFHFVKNIDSVFKFALIKNKNK